MSLVKLLWPALSANRLSLSLLSLITTIHNTIPALFSPGVTTGSIALEMKDRIILLWKLEWFLTFLSLFFLFLSILFYGKYRKC